MVDIRLAPPAEEPVAGALAVEAPADPAQARLAGGRLARELPPGETTVDARGLAGETLAAFAEGLVLGCYRFAVNERPDESPSVVTLGGALDADALERGRRRAAATVWARDLANTRSNVKNPAWLAGQAQERLAPAGVTVVERDEAWLRDQGFGGMLAVGAGSASPPRLIEAAWRPRGAAAGPHVVLVGKGITFDTGGLNRKAGDGMTTMYTDMSGGAAVLGALLAVASERVPVRVTALVPSAENSFGGTSYRPSDVVRHYGGRTSEIHNTDAEGRLVLADALAYAVARLRPTVLVDVATLTGAMKLALGLRLGGLFASTEALAGELLAAGRSSGESLWRMPLPAEYESRLHSEVADATNAPGNPGAVTAALFLRPFAGRVPWAHLDIAGPARAGEDDGILARGATGFGVALLQTWIESLA